MTDIIPGLTLDPGQQITLGQTSFGAGPTFDPNQAVSSGGLTINQQGSTPINQGVLGASTGGNIGSNTGGQQSSSNNPGGPGAPSYQGNVVNQTVGAPGGSY